MGSLNEANRYRTIVSDIKKAVNVALNTLIDGGSVEGYTVDVNRKPSSDDQEAADKYGFTSIAAMLNREQNSAHLGTFNSRSSKGLEADVYLKFVVSDKIEQGTFHIDGSASTDEASIEILLGVHPNDGKGMISKINVDLTDLIRHELEHLTQRGVEELPGKYIRNNLKQRSNIRQDRDKWYKYFLLKDEIDANLQGLYVKAKHVKKPYKEVVDAYLTGLVDNEIITADNKKEIFNVWQKRALEIGGLPALNESSSIKYTIYCDMDGVLTDFEERFEHYSGYDSPQTYEKKFGAKAFWELVDEEIGEVFWSKMKWMNNGKVLWDYIKGYSPEILTTPSLNKVSRDGKRKWIDENVSSSQIIHFSPSTGKQNYAHSKAILIDDKKSNIEEWRAAGGIAIRCLRGNVAPVLRKLKELGI